MKTGYGVLIGLIIAGTSSAAVIALDMDSLPSAQGWEYVARGIHADVAEEDVYSADGSVLSIDSMGLGTINASAPFSALQYNRKDVVSSPGQTVLEWTSRTLNWEGNLLGYYTGFQIYLRMDGLDVYIGILSNRIMIADGTGVKILNIDATTYHTYRIEIEENGAPTYDFYIDGVLRASPRRRSVTHEGNLLAFGDASMRLNTQSDISYLKLTQVTHEIGLLDSLNTNGCVEATGPEGATVHFYVDELVSSSSNVYHWSTSSGDTGEGETFDCSIGVDQEETICLTAEDSVTGETNTVTRTVCVSDTTAPEIVILSPRKGDVFTGDNLGMDVQIIDAVDWNIADYQVSINYTYHVPLDPASGTSKVKLLKPDKESGEVPVEVVVTVEDFSGNASSETVQVLLHHDNRGY